MRAAPPVLGPLAAAYCAFVRERAGLLDARVRDGRIVDAHGDLRPEHVCLLDPPVVIDCLEFNRELRLVDPFDELAFLGFECALLGAPWIRGRLIEHCADKLADRPPEAPPPLGLNLLMGASTSDKVNNVIRNLEEDRIVVVEGVLDVAE